MTGRVKDHFWEQIEAGACEPGYDQEPDDLEMLAQDARMAAERYEGALKEKDHERSR